MILLAFMLGLFCGATLGVLIMAVFVIGARGDAMFGGDRYE